MDLLAVLQVTITPRNVLLAALRTLFMYPYVCRMCWGLLLVLPAYTAVARADNAQEVKALSEDIQQLKSQVIDLNSDLRILEEKLLFPSSSKFSFFVSLSSGQFFTLESIKLKIDGVLVTTQLYTEQDRQALARGGIDKLYMTNLSEGEHQLTAFFTGLGPAGRPYKRAADLTFRKKPAEGIVEIAIVDQAATQEPTFELRQR